MPSVEREIGRLPRKKHSEAKRLAAKIELEARVVWNRLQKAGGAMPFDDHSSAAEIQAEFGISKKAFKRGLGRLYRQRRVELLPRGVRAVTQPANDEDRKR
jgi:predicted RNA-binding protein (virulence factor B family)